MTHRPPLLAAPRRALFRSALPLAAVLALAGCATPAATPPAATTDLTLTAWSADISRPLPADTVLVATLKFHVDDFQPDIYVVSGLFDTTLVNGTIKTISKTPNKLTSSDGEVKLSLPLADALKDPDIRKPLRVRFFLTKRVSTTNAVPVAMTATTSLRVQEATP